MTRIRRTFIAALAATALTASMGVNSSTAVEAQASACTYSIFKITKRQNVTCRKAKWVLKNDPRIGGGDGHPGWKCSYGRTVMPEGRCRKGTSRSFRYSQK